jgi:NADH:ubiquinone oxidoreductase subunit 6 (subunit J)
MLWALASLEVVNPNSLAYAVGQLLGALLFFWMLWKLWRFKVVRVIIIAWLVLSVGSILVIPVLAPTDRTSLGSRR